MLWLMSPGADVDKVVFTKCKVRSNQYALQVHADLVNGMLASIGLNSDEVNLLRGPHFKNPKLFFAQLNCESVNTVVAQFGSTPFKYNPLRGAVAWVSLVCLLCTKFVSRGCTRTMLGILGPRSPINIQVLGPNKIMIGMTELGESTS